ncbi:MAG: thioredoxin [Candidatus Magasanikbacteria bacterium CG10_big_fil_rev_8_21_14_0_10_40_10]|uniref:Thioredoxin n=1 Tax=Candidatus Magasanikbacteria bacterium CG10_big_fil_rev_8_21_14_0_10_40_10 TaxID=1974648 RepID=A0A2M6W3B9_9BACT|nr:MAG: thioredoxin [Candidatus Magasanikbacteria bacterium CG10_big_fil_rev_8_21_14_0_10_40_10]
MSQVFNNENFNQEVLGSDVPVFVDFWAPWCGPCQMMGPIIDELYEEYKNKKVKIGKCNVDENNDIAAQYSVMSIPAFKIFKGGSVVDEAVGGLPKEKLKEMIDKQI